MEFKAIGISFFPKPSTSLNGRSYLYARITLSGKRRDISLRYELDYEEWDHNTHSLRKKHRDYYYVIRLTEQFRKQVLNIQQEFIQLGLPIELHAVSERLKGKDMGRTAPTLLEIFERQIQKKTQAGGKYNSKATIQKYTRCKTHLEHFNKKRSGENDIALHLISLEFIEEFEQYLKDHGNCNHNSSMKHIQTFKTIFKYALAHGWARKDPFQQFKVRMYEVVRDFLTEDEIQKLMRVELPPTRHRQVRDIFLFSCFTGLSYIDVANLQMRNIQYENGNYWIRTRRKKTNVKSNIPLLEYPLHLISKFHPDIRNADPDEKVFKVISNQKMNKYLKELAELATIKKQLTFHIARHTFATTITLNNGVPIESVSSMLGHRNITTTQHYAKLLDKKLEEDMAVLAHRLKFKNHDQ